MRSPKSREVLDKMIGGEDLDEADLRALAALPSEDLYLEFKDGAETDDQKKASRTLRQYVSGFANSDGGLLVFGVGDAIIGTSRPFTKTTRPGGKPLNEWARNVLESLAGGLVPPPRIQVLVVDACEVLIVGIARAPSLVSCNEGNEVRYYLRLGDSTPSVPPYLISDLVLGRRVHPSLELREGRVAVNGSAEDPSCLVAFGFEVENVGMVPAADIVVGVISWACEPRDPNWGRIAPDYLRRFFDLQPAAPMDESGNVLWPVHVSSRRKPAVPLDLGAFEAGIASGIGKLLVPREAAPISVRSALYIVASGHPPEWWQLDWAVPPPRGETTMKLTRCYIERPVLAWKPDALPNPA
jgi:hypothetical protein